MATRPERAAFLFPCVLQFYDGPELCSAMEYTIHGYSASNMLCHGVHCRLLCSSSQPKVFLFLRSIFSNSAVTHDSLERRPKRETQIFICMLTLHRYKSIKFSCRLTGRARHYGLRRANVGLKMFSFDLTLTCVFAVLLSIGAFSGHVLFQFGHRVVWFNFQHS